MKEAPKSWELDEEVIEKGMCTLLSDGKGLLYRYEGCDTQDSTSTFFVLAILRRSKRQKDEEEKITCDPGPPFNNTMAKMAAGSYLKS